MIWSSSNEKKDKLALFLAELVTTIKPKRNIRFNKIEKYKNIHFNEEKHLKNVQQITFGGQNAEGYFG